MKKFIEQNNIKLENGRISYTDINTGKQINKEFLLTLDDVHKRLSKIEYEKEYEKCKNIKDYTIERTRMIPFAYVYYYHVAKNMQIPTPNEFVDEYFDMFCNKNKEDKYEFKKEYNISGRGDISFDYLALKARILRSYNTFNREIEFLIKLTEKAKDIKVIYNLYDDLFSGMDLIIKYKDKTIGIAEYVDTKRSRKLKEDKNDHRQNYNGKEMIDVVATFGGKDKNVCSYGEVFCYDDKTVWKLEKQIKGELIKDVHIVNTPFAKIFEQQNIKIEDFNR